MHIRETKTGLTEGKTIRLHQRIQTAFHRGTKVQLINRGFGKEWNTEFSPLHEENR